jgi:hypothetical protein
MDGLIWKLRPYSWILFSIIIIIIIIIIVDFNKLERIQINILTLYHNIFFKDIEYAYDILLEGLNFQTLRKSCRQLDALNLRAVFVGTKYWSCALETVDLGVPVCNIL